MEEPFLGEVSRPAEAHHDARRGLCDGSLERGARPVLSSRGVTVNVTDKVLWAVMRLVSRGKC